MKPRSFSLCLGMFLALGAWLAPSPALAASVKSVQSGSVTMTSSSQSASITTVDTTKAFVVCESRTDSKLAINRVTCTLSASSVTITAGGTPNNNLVVQWYVVEFEGGASVQRGTASFADTGLTNSTNESTRYYYKAFAKTGTGGGTCYAPGTVNTTNGVNASPVAGPDPAWGSMLAGGSILKGGIAGTGKLYTTSNANWIISVNTSDGTQSWTPVATSGAVQGWLSWFPVSGSTDSAVIGGDQAGHVYSVNADTGATNWNVTLTGAEQIQAPVAVQLRSSSNAAFQSTFTTDVIFTATRNSSATNNKVFALRASDGAVLWTFNPDPTPPYSVDYIVGQPWVDYARNYLYVASRAGTSGTQNSLWVLSTLDGSVVASFALGHLETSPTQSADGATLYVGSKDASNPGKLYAIDVGSLALKWSSGMSLGSTSTAYINGFVWEDFTTAGRLYFTTADGNAWCVQDPGAGSPPGSAVWKTAVAGPSTPVLIDKLYVGSSDGKLHQFNTSSGVDEKQATVGDGTATVGDASTEDSSQIYVGTTAGKIYKFALPLP